MDDDELARIRAKFGPRWTVESEERAFTVYKAVRGNTTVFADSAGRLEDLMSDADACRPDK